MNGTAPHCRRILAIDPTTKGFGFAVLEGPELLVDWGVKHAGGGLNHRNRKCREEISRLTTRYQPDALIVECTGVKSCRRRRRARRLIASLLVFARNHHLRARRVSRRSMQRSLSETGTATKREIAVRLTERFSELKPHLPHQWEGLVKRLHADDSEDERMGIFDALAFGLTFYESQSRERKASAPLTPQEFLRHA